MTFEDRDDGTRVLFVQSGFDDASQRDGNAEAWRTSFAALQRSLAA